MAKITVKRFLNKKIKPLIIYNNISLGYPLYYSITYNRKTQYIKSICGAVMTEKAFQYLQDNNKPLNYETNYLNSGFDFLLKNELEYIGKAVHFIVKDNEKENIFDEDFVPKLKSYFDRLDNSLFFIGWLKYYWVIEPKNILEKGKTFTVKEIMLLETVESKEESRIKKIYNNSENRYFQIEDLYYSFNKEKNLLTNINTLENILNVDLKKYFYLDTIKFWYVIDLIIKFHNEESTNYHAIKIDFIINKDDNNYVKINEKFKYPLSDNEILNICKILKYHALIF